MRPRNHFNCDAAVFAVNPPHGVKEDDRHGIDRDVFETALLEAVVSVAPLTTSRAIRPVVLSRQDVDDDFRP